MWRRRRRRRQRGGWSWLWFGRTRREAASYASEGRSAAARTSPRGRRCRSAQRRRAVEQRRGSLWAHHHRAEPTTRCGSGWRRRRRRRRMRGRQHADVRYRGARVPTPPRTACRRLSRSARRAPAWVLLLLPVRFWWWLPGTAPDASDPSWWCSTALVWVATWACPSILAGCCWECGCTGWRGCHLRSALCRRPPRCTRAAHAPLSLK